MLELDVLKYRLPSLLIYGETGTGKTYLAKEIHRKLYKGKPFVHVDLASLNENLFESELFGNAKGAFTSADQNKLGYIDQVKDGILFLDEIGEITHNQQLKLLRLLDEKIYHPVGSIDKKSFTGTIIMATNKDLKGLVQEKKFRQDLYFRINAFTYFQKSFRSKLDEIESLIPEGIEIENQVLEIFRKYSWPGNRREFENCLRYMLLFDSTKIKLAHLPPWLKNDQIKKNTSYKQALADFDREFITEALNANFGKINQTSRSIGLNKVTLIKKIKNYNLKQIARI
jgi:transcriptional regulator with PAS, ATPase and Fis domain